MSPASIPNGFMDGNNVYSIPTPQNGEQNQGTSAKATVIDGTPARVAAIGIAAAAVVIAFRWAGIRFNVAVSS